MSLFETMMGKMSPENMESMMGNFMDGMMSKMTKDERVEFIEKMMSTNMDKMFDGLSAEEKSHLMKSMMPKMMSSMMGGGGMSGMMEMMFGDKEGGSSPMDMCKQMMEGIKTSQELATYATPEVRGLFEDWAEEVAQNLLDYLKEKNKPVTPEDIADKLRVSVGSAIFFISKLAREGKVKITSVELAQGNG